MCKYQELSSKLFRDKLNMCFIRLSFNKFQLENVERKWYPQHFFVRFLLHNPEDSNFCGKNLSRQKCIHKSFVTEKVYNKQTEDNCVDIFVR